MKILYYIPDISQHMGGLRQYAVALLKILGNDRENEYYVYHEVNDPEVLAVLNSHKHFHLVKQPVKGNNRYIKRLQRMALAPYTKLTGRQYKKDFIASVCKKKKIDIIHCPYQFLPVVDKVKAICTMHDVQEIHFPEYFTAEDRAHRAVVYLKYMRHASHIMVSYQHIKNDLIKYFNVAEKQVSVCLLDMGNLWLDRYKDTDIDLSLDLPETFLFYAANTWEHKNHLKLLQAIYNLGDQHNKIHLVFTGNKTGYYQDVLQPFIEKHNLQSRVHFMGIVDEKILYTLYKRCTAVVVPTMYEAGSFPLMEAILLSVPVICSNVTSLPETIKDEEFVFDPEDLQAISQRVELIVYNNDYRKRNIDNSKVQARLLRNTHALDKIRAAYEATAS